MDLTDKQFIIGSTNYSCYGQICFWIFADFWDKQILPKFYADFAQILWVFLTSCSAVFTICTWYFQEPKNRTTRGLAVSNCHYTDKTIFFFQTPKALGIFCLLHFGISLAVDVTIGMYFSLRYMVLILQGVFIVWSLLLSAGYFYIFSAMNK